ncbi:MAG: hypothetical protein HY741_03860 [Chloroflexi bacterium]|nr:hypothetical protein [Chloroflexota bacterium]
MGPEFDEMAGQPGTGECPEEIEKTMSELGRIGENGGTWMKGMDDDI